MEEVEVIQCSSEERTDSVHLHQSQLVELGRGGSVGVMCEEVIGVWGDV